MSAPDLELARSHGFYELRPLTDKGRTFITESNFTQLLSWNRDSLLLDSFFANAGDWIRAHAMTHALQPIVQWGESTYQGEQGAALLWDECA